MGKFQTAESRAAAPGGSAATLHLHDAVERMVGGERLYGGFLTDLLLGPGGPAPDVPVELVHRLLRLVFYAEAPGLVAEGPGESAELLAKEALNAFALMAPNGPDGERRVKGGAVYAGLAMANHECFPNAARVDAPDGSLRMVRKRLPVQAVILSLAL